jgi:hypothetical protein
VRRAVGPGRGKHRHGRFRERGRGIEFGHRSSLFPVA